MRALIVIALVAWPQWAAAEDKWFAADKAKHFGAGAAIAGGGYAAAAPLTRRARWRIAVGTGAGVAAAAGKELRDRRRGQGSWRDVAWTAGGAATGALVAWIVDKATD
jgi:uncharacterized protein YfiM (DUF2279 family)